MSKKLFHITSDISKKVSKDLMLRSRILMLMGKILTIRISLLSIRILVISLILVTSLEMLRETTILVWIS